MIRGLILGILLFIRNSKKYREQKGNIDITLERASLLFQVHKVSINLCCGDVLVGELFDAVVNIRADRKNALLKMILLLHRHRSLQTHG